MVEIGWEDEWMLYLMCLLFSADLLLNLCFLCVLKCIISETNKNLYDSNDGLRSALANAAKRRVGQLLLTIPPVIRSV